MGYKEASCKEYVQYAGDIYKLTENEEMHILKTDKNSRGFKMTVCFTKDKEEHEESMETIKEFMVNTIISELENRSKMKISSDEDNDDE